VCLCVCVRVFVYVCTRAFLLCVCACRSGCLPVRCRRQALAPTACTTIEEVGSTGVGALTLGFLALAVSTVVMVAKAASADAERRKYYFVNTFICGVATFSYFAMLSGQGWTAIAGCRQFFYARYIDWMITTALLILDLGLVAGQDFVTIAAVIGADSKCFLYIYLALHTLFLRVFQQQDFRVYIRGRRCRAVRSQHSGAEGDRVVADGSSDDHRGIHGCGVGRHDRQMVLVPFRHGHVPASDLLARTYLSRDRYHSQGP